MYTLYEKPARAENNDMTERHNKSLILQVIGIADLMLLSVSHNENSI